MTVKSGMEYMMEYVREYLDGESSRMDFDLDFNHYLIKHYPRMERQNAGLAECFYFYIAEEGFDQAVGLSDAEHKNLFRKQFAEFESAMRDGSL